jgi:hypothetical protein
MTPLTDRQQELLLDYVLGMAGPHETAQVEELLATNSEAADLKRLFKSALSPLDHLAPEPCPDDLVEKTVMRLKARAETELGGQGHEGAAASQAVETSRPATIRLPFWRNWTEVVAAAAAIILFVGVLLPALGAVRQRYYRMRCGSNLAGIHGGLASYLADHDGVLPAVAMEPGSPWWKVGYQGRENLSNTRRGWLLVKHNYVEPSRFVCAGRAGAERADFANLEVARHNDFPGRAYIHFSIRIPCPSEDLPCADQKRVLMADLNPLSEQFPDTDSRELSIELCKELLTANSRNHGGRGQNLLISDGSVEFARQRNASISDDDIYTLQAMSCGSQVHGVELPACERDTFLAP